MTSLTDLYIRSCSIWILNSSHVWYNWFDSFFQVDWQTSCSLFFEQWCHSLFSLSLSAWKLSKSNRIISKFELGWGRWTFSAIKMARIWISDTLKAFVTTWRPFLPARWLNVQGENTTNSEVFSRTNRTFTGQTVTPGTCLTRIIFIQNRTCKFCMSVRYKPVVFRIRFDSPLKIRKCVDLSWNVPSLNVGPDTL